MSVELNQEQQKIMNNLIYAFMAGEFKHMIERFGAEAYLKEMSERTRQHWSKIA